MSVAFIYITQAFVDAGFTSALIQNKENSSLTYSSVFFINLILGIIVTAIFVLTAPYIGSFYNEPRVATIIQILSLTFIINSFNQVQIAILSRNLNFKALTIREVIASSTSGIVAIIAAFQGFGVYALVVQTLLAAIIRTILIWGISDWRPSFAFSMGEVKKLFSFSSYVFIDRVVSQTFSKLDVILIGKVFSPATLGFYSRAVSLKDQVTLYSSSSINRVFYPVLSSLQDEKGQYERVYYKLISVVTSVSFFMTGVLLILGEPIIIGLFGSKWAPSVPLFEILVLGVCIFPLNVMMVNALMSKGKSKENFLIGLVRKLIRLIPLFIAFYYGLIEFTIAEVLISYLVTLLNIYFLKRIVHLSVKVHLYKIFEGMILFLPLALIYYFFEVESVLSRMIMVSIFVSLTVAYNWIFKSELFLFTAEKLNNYRRRRG